MKILLAHGDLSAGGGAEAYAAGLIAALRRAGHRIGTLDIQGHVRPDGIKTRPWIMSFGSFGFTKRFALWKYALVCHVLPKIARNYDRVVLSYGEGPALPCPSLRLMHAPALFSTNPPLLATLGAPLAGPGFWLRRMYAGVCRFLARPVASASGAMNVANSDWTAAMARAHAGIDTTRVIYPFIASPKHTIKGPNRDRHRILALGRIVANKRLEEAVAIVEELRADGVPATLQIVGRANTRYARNFLAKMRDHPHLILTPDADEAALARALAAARIGIHGYRHEHFGIAVGEMIAAGVLPLVFDGGGVCEPVPETQLRFRDASDAVAKAKVLIQAPNRDCFALNQRLRSTPTMQAASRFEAETDALLAEFLGPA